MFNLKNLKISKTKNPKVLPEINIFGSTFTDHMILIEWSKDVGWSDPIIKPYAPLELWPSSSVLHYGISCFEGMKAYKSPNNRDILLFRPELNMERFSLSSNRLTLPFIDEKGLLELIIELLKIDQRWIPNSRASSLYIRPTLIGTTESLGIKIPEKAILFVICSPVSSYYKNNNRGLSLYVEDEYCRAWKGGSGNFKVASNYAPTLIAMKERKEFDQILWLYGEEKWITEVSTMNIFILFKNGHLITPPLFDNTILAGITRRSIIEMVMIHKIIQEEVFSNIRVIERKIGIDELIESILVGNVQEMFGTGTAALISPIEMIYYKGKEYRLDVNNNSFSNYLMNTLLDIQHGIMEGPQGWRVTI